MTGPGGRVTPPGDSATEGGAGPSSSAVTAAEFATATSVTAVTSGDHTGVGDAGVSSIRRWRAHIDDGWDIGGVPNGVYVLAIVGRAMAEATGRPPLSITAHYLAPARPGPCVVEVETVRAGRRMSTVTGRLLSGDTEILRTLGTFGQATDDGPVTLAAPPPDVPPYDRCPAQGVRPGAGVTLPNVIAKLANRLRPGDEGFATGHRLAGPK